MKLHDSGIQVDPVSDFQHAQIQSSKSSVPSDVVVTNFELWLESRLHINLTAEIRVMDYYVTEDYVSVSSKVWDI